MKPQIWSEILNLTSTERIRLAQDIWQSVEEFSDSDMLSSQQKEELDKRLAKFYLEGSTGAPWREVINQIRLTQR
jgi:putative addiction module component (TIGR02574 family)